MKIQLLDYTGRELPTGKGYTAGGQTLFLYIYEDNIHTSSAVWENSDFLAYGARYVKDNGLIIHTWQFPHAPAGARGGTFTVTPAILFLDKFKQTHQNV